MVEKNTYTNTRQLEEQNEELMNELFKMKSKPRGRIGYLFIVAGSVLFALSVDYSSYIIAFLSLALLFWGGLFLYIRPKNFVRQDVLFSILSDAYSFNDRANDSASYLGEPHYISPKTLSGFKEVYIYIPKDKGETIDYENLSSAHARSRFIQIPPLGLGIAKLIEKESKLNLSTLDLEKSMKIMEKVLVEDLELLNEFESNIDGQIIQIKMVESIFDGMYEELKYKKRRFTDDYLASAIACSLAKVTHKPVIIENITRKEEESTTSTSFRII
jgi:hypothetical protein